MSCLAMPARDGKENAGKGNSAKGGDGCWNGKEHAGKGNSAVSGGNQKRKKIDTNGLWVH